MLHPVSPLPPAAAPVVLVTERSGEISTFIPRGGTLLFTGVDAALGHAAGGERPL